MTGFFNLRTMSWFSFPKFETKYASLFSPPSRIGFPTFLWLIAIVLELFINMADYQFADQFSIECRKPKQTQIKVITLANNKGHKNTLNQLKLFHLGADAKRWKTIVGESQLILVLPQTLK